MANRALTQVGSTALGGNEWNGCLGAFGCGIGCRAQNVGNSRPGISLLAGSTRRRRPRINHGLLPFGGLTTGGDALECRLNERGRASAIKRFTAD